MKIDLCACSGCVYPQKKGGSSKRVQRPQRVSPSFREWVMSTPCLHFIRHHSHSPPSNVDKSGTSSFQFLDLHRLPLHPSLLSTNGESPPSSLLLLLSLPQPKHSKPKTKGQKQENERDFPLLFSFSFQSCNHYTGKRQFFFATVQSNLMSIRTNRILLQTCHDHDRHTTTPLLPNTASNS